jgi:hypothetical protein
VIRNPLKVTPILYLRKQTIDYSPQLFLCLRLKFPKARFTCSWTPPIWCSTFWNRTNQTTVQWYVKVKTQKCSFISGTKGTKRLILQFAALSLAPSNLCTLERIYSFRILFWTLTELDKITYIESMYINFAMSKTFFDDYGQLLKQSLKPILKVS